MAGCTKRRLAWRAFGQGSGNSRNSRSRQASGSAAAACARRRPTGADCPAAARSPRRPPAPGGTAASRCRSRTPRRRSARPRDGRRPAPARARRRRSRPPARAARRRGDERRARVARLGQAKRRRGSVTSSSALLARPQLVAALPAVQPVGRRLDPPAAGRVAQRPNAAFSAGTRSVFSHVKVPFASSGSRPKWP